MQNVQQLLRSGNAVCGALDEREEVLRGCLGTLANSTFHFPVVVSEPPFAFLLLWLADS